MTYLTINEIETPIEIKDNSIINIKFNNRKLFLEFYYALENKDSEIINLSKNFIKNYNLNKDTIFIKNLLDLDLNDKKILTSLYKIIDKKAADYHEKMEEIKNRISNLLIELSLELEGEIEFNDEFPLSKLLSISNFQFSKSENSCLNNLITYIIQFKNITNLHFIFINDGLRYLNENEIKMIKDFLLKEGISLINFYFDNSKILDKECCTLINIDEDCCLY